MDGYAQTIRFMLDSFETCNRSPDLWDMVVGIPLDEWMAADTVWKLRRAKIRRWKRERFE